MLKRTLLSAALLLVVTAMLFAQLPPGTTGVKGTLEGTVLDDSTQAPIPHVFIVFLRSGMMSMWTNGVMTDAAGHYAVKVDTGVYLLRAMPSPWSRYMPEWYDNSPDSANAMPVHVTEGATLVADFGLSKGSEPPLPESKGFVSGTVLDGLTLKPIPWVKILFFNANAATAWPMKATTNGDGYYEAVLDTGVYILKAQPPVPSPWQGGYKAEWYDNVDDPANATPVHVRPKERFTADFKLAPLPQPTIATVEGTVTDTLGNPLRRAAVVFMRTLQEMSGWSMPIDPGMAPSGEHFTVDGFGDCRGVLWMGWTDSNGHYRASLLSGRGYAAMAAKRGYVPEYFNNQDNPKLADVIKLNGDTTGIDFSLAPVPTFTNSTSGTVKDTVGQGVPSRIVVFPAQHKMFHAKVRFGHTDSTGAYTIGNLPPGKYFVLAIPFSDYAPAFYKAGAFGVMCWKDADTVAVDGAITGIDIGVVAIKWMGVAQLHGRVTTSAGDPIEGVSMYAASTGGDVLGYGLTDQAGNYAIDGLPQGTLRIVSDCEGFTAAENTATFGSGEFSKQFDLVLLPSGTTFVSPPTRVPDRFAVEQNYPNPFNPTTAIRYQVSAPSHVRLVVYDLVGREIATLVNEVKAPGVYTVAFDGSNLPSGVYLYKLTAGTFSNVRKMVLTK